MNITPGIIDIRKFMGIHWVLLLNINLPYFLFQLSLFGPICLAINRQEQHSWARCMNHCLSTVTV